MWFEDFWSQCHKAEYRGWAWADRPLENNLPQAFQKSNSTYVLWEAGWKEVELGTVHCTEDVGSNLGRR